jgi:hypothetical protein
MQPPQRGSDADDDDRPDQDPDGETHVGPT